MNPLYSPISLTSILFKPCTHSNNFLPASCFSVYKVSSIFIGENPSLLSLVCSSNQIVSSSIAATLLFNLAISSGKYLITLSCNEYLWFINSCFNSFSLETSVSKVVFSNIKGLPVANAFISP